jgi:SAM-dependent methyltransferase
MSENRIHLYNDLAWLWPLWGDATTTYAAWCDEVTQLIRKYTHREVRTLLNMGCGGGKNVFNLKNQFAVTGIDISRAMLELAQQLNPESRFLLGDMRSWSLDQEFDAVLIDDAISYMTHRADLAAVFQNAYRHLRAGGVMVVEPDFTKETFRQNCTRVSYANAKVKPAHIDVVFIENDYDPDLADDTYEGTIIYLIRESGKLRVEEDRSVMGLFSVDVWRTALHEAGFEVHDEVYSDEPGRIIFACVKHA